MAHESIALSCDVMRRIFLLVGVSACGLFPSLGDLEGSDAQPPFDASAEVPVPTQDGGDAAAVCGFPIGPTNGLVAYYAFDDGQGLIAHDCTSNQLDGTFIRQDVGAWVTGKHGGAVRLGAPTGCIELGNSPLLKFSSALTVSVWVEIATYPTGTNVGYIFAKGQTVSATGYRWGLEPSVMMGLKLATGTDAGAFSLSGAGPALTAWHHLAWTFDTGKTSIYLDGVSAAVSTTAPPSLFDDPTSTLTVGCHPGSTIYPFQGVIDEMRVYNRALTQSEITSLVQ